jgi:hypothetical protein
MTPSLDRLKPGTRQLFEKRLGGPPIRRYLLANGNIAPIDQNSGWQHNTLEIREIDERLTVLVNHTTDRAKRRAKILDMIQNVKAYHVLIRAVALRYISDGPLHSTRHTPGPTPNGPRGLTQHPLRHVNKG